MGFLLWEAAESGRPAITFSLRVLLDQRAGFFEQLLAVAALGVDGLDPIVVDLLGRFHPAGLLGLGQELDLLPWPSSRAAVSMMFAPDWASSPSSSSVTTVPKVLASLALRTSRSKRWPRFICAFVTWARRCQLQR